MIWWTVGLALVVFVVAITAMAVGVLLGNRQLRGSCGGLANWRDARGRTICDACTNPAPDCGGVEDGQQRQAE